MPSFTNFNTLNLVKSLCSQTHGHKTNTWTQNKHTDTKKNTWTQNKHMDTKQTHGQKQTYGHKTNTWTQNKHMDKKQTHGHKTNTWTQNKHMDTKQTHGHILFNMNFNEMSLGNVILCNEILFETSSIYVYIR